MLYKGYRSLSCSCLHATRCFAETRAEGESVGDGEEENRLLTGSGGEEWANGAKDRQQTTFSQPEQSYESAFNKVRVASSAYPHQNLTASICSGFFTWLQNVFKALAAVLRHGGSGRDLPSSRERARLFRNVDRSRLEPTAPK